VSRIEDVIATEVARAIERRLQPLEERVAELERTSEALVGDLPTPELVGRKRTLPWPRLRAPT